jgi:hypothetical protein
MVDEREERMLSPWGLALRLEERILGVTTPKF